jgi:DNA-directed RNA polymerase subunit H (RpoH/RPB5)
MIGLLLKYITIKIFILKKVFKTMSSRFPIVFERTLEMLKDRKYKIPKKLKNFKLTTENMKTFLNTHCGTIYAKNYETEQGGKQKKKYTKIMIFFSITKFGIKEMRTKMKDILSQKIDHIILVLENKFTLHGQKLLNSYDNLEKEVFYFNEMIINAVNHTFVPKHELLSKQNSKILIKTVGSKIPCIKKNDRICRHFNGKCGQIFRIYRKNELYYRIVIK